MKRCIFVVPYYGKWPKTFREWVFSAGYLKDQDVDFLLVTDLDIAFELPSNFRVLRLSLAQLKSRFQAVFDFDISLETPYKLCDFKPAIGKVLSEELKGYDFWGHCDCDLIWGDFRSAFADEVFEKYDRIQYLGHCILYRNTPEMNELHTFPGNYYDYRTVYSSPLYYSFDEHPGMLNIVHKNGIRNYIGDVVADISPIYDRMQISRRNNYRYQIVYWYNGRIFRTGVDKDNSLQTEEFLYCHFQRKHPLPLSCWHNGREPVAFILYADHFEEFDPNTMTAEFVKAHADFVSDKKDRADKRRYIFRKIAAFIKMPMKERIVWIRLRLATKKATKRLPLLMECIDYK